MTKNLVKAQQNAPSYHDSNLSKLVDADRARPYDILQLSPPSLNALRRAGLSNVGDVIDAWKSGDITKRKRFGSKVPVEVPARLSTLQRYLEPGTHRVYWTRFAHDPTIGGVTRLYIAGPEFDRLCPAERSRDIGSLHLSRAHLLLRKFEIHQVGEFIRFFANGLPSELPGIGKSKLREIEESAQRLSLAINQDGHVDWIQIANDLGHEILPRKKQRASQQQQLERCLPDVVLRIGALTSQNRGVEIARDRLLLPRPERPTLEQISQRYGITRERVRQLEDSILSALRNGLFHSNYEQLPFRFRTELEISAQRTRDHFATFGNHIWKLPEWLRELSSLWDVPESFVNQYATLFTELFEFEAIISSNPRLPPTLYPPNLAIAERDRHYRRMMAVQKALKEAPEPLPADSLLKAANAHLNRDMAIQANELLEVIRFSKHIETTPDGQFDFRFTKLSFARQAARILRTAGKPLHLRDIRERILTLSPDSPVESMTNSSLSKRLAYLDQLVAVGRTGYWAHQSWMARQQPQLEEYAQTALQTSGEPLRSLELVKSLPPWQRHSVKTIRQALKEAAGRFVAHGGDSWSLADWNEGPASLSSVALTEFLLSLFAEAESKTIDFQALQASLSEATGLSAREARKALRFHPALDLQPADDGWVAMFNSLEDPHLNPPKQRGRWPSCTQPVHDWLHQKFDDAGADVLPLVDLAYGIREDLDLTLATAYAVIRKSDEFETEGGKRFRSCRRVSPPERGKTPAIRHERTSIDESDTTLAH